MSLYKVEFSLVYSPSKTPPQVRHAAVRLPSALQLVSSGSLGEVLLEELGVYKYAIFHIDEFQSS